ncbi:hypothetical protein [Clostridium ljungdahlii]|uniref:Uncharacterized protein n=1 Tax=Clostridium ljungdahlii TaxID=1538 RepID=A0A162L312_9CLOT|nr:hypothetical protein [Clostridium ljungdahlii]OAA90432.1 hypothetical protein WY13_01336 [Clostridium ljungdahlii]
MSFSNEKAEYIKLIAKSAKGKDLATFSLDNNNDMLKIIDELDRDIKELYSVNPYIRLYVTMQ